MKDTAGKKSKAADEIESEMEDRDDARSEEQRDQGEDLNQGMQTGTHDSQRLGVNWPPSYRHLKKKKPASKRGK